MASENYPKYTYKGIMTNNINTLFRVITKYYFFVSSIFLINFIMDTFRYLKGLKHHPSKTPPIPSEVIQGLYPKSEKVQENV